MIGNQINSGSRVTGMQSKDFLRLFTYDDWANRECIVALRAAKSNSSESNSANDAKSTEMIARIAHILSAQKLWLDRIQKQPQSMAVWPVATLDECTALADEMSVAWRKFLERVDNHFAPGSLHDRVEYRNSRGESWASSVEDILTHVLFHSAYHRGQIALQMRASGAEPAYTDFIHAVRKGFVE
jgi:uncharacterized damage-inducible protein DinB